LIATSGHQYPALRPYGDSVFSGELALQRLDERRQSLNRPVAMVAQLIAEPPRRVDGFNGWRIRDHALSERDGPRRFRRPSADDGNDRRLDGRQATRLDVGALEEIVL